MYNSLFREFLTHMMEDPRNITACMHLHFIAKNIERMGDHATGDRRAGDLPCDAAPCRKRRGRRSTRTVDHAIGGTE